MKVDPGSFRDPSGYVFHSDNKIFRTINEVYRPHWEKAEAFLRSLAKEGLLLPFEYVEPVEGSWKTIEVEKLPFISYPYEWSHEQLKDAALLTLELQRRALDQGLILKDASAYNVQFKGGKPVFIDHLSFEMREDDSPWIAYQQFCTHFIAPLAVMSSVDLRCGHLSQLWMDGIPLDIAAAMLPKKKRRHPGLQFHLVLHAKLQNKYSDAEKHADKAKEAKATVDYLKGLADSLERLIKSKAISMPDVSTEWGDYYTFTNYSDEAAEQKRVMVEELARRFGSDGFAIDLGANNGHYTRVIAPYFSQVAAVDIDPVAVNRHYLALKDPKAPGNVLPLIIDLANPSPSIGFNNAERASFAERCKADFIVALALIHHIRITAGIPLALIAEFFSSLLSEEGVLVLEFVPKEDSQTKKLLALRQDIFFDFDLDQCVELFSPYFECVSVDAIPNTHRHLLLLKKRPLSHD